MGWFASIAKGLKKTASGLADGLKHAVGLGTTLDGPLRDALEDTLLQADCGMPMTHALLKDLAALGLPAPLTLDALRTGLATVIAARLAPLAQPFTPTATGPTVILLAGVNGSGKTTTVGKLAAQWARTGTHVVVGAADTFRAAAAEQLAVWAGRADDAARKKGRVDILAGASGGDAAGVAYAAVDKALRDQADMVLIDTAGRLPNRHDLLAELPKIARVVKKLIPEAPHQVWLVLDATLGQSTLAQVKAFHAQIPATGVIVTKLDGSAKAGFLLALADALPTPLPVFYIGTGEGLDDIGPFDAPAFARALVGLDTETP